MPARESNAAPLTRFVDLTLSRTPLRDALQQIAARAGIEIWFWERTATPLVRVSLHVEHMTVRQALAEVLQGTGLDAYVSLSGRGILVRHPVAQPGLFAQQQTGRVHGRVTDAKTGQGLPGVTLALDARDFGATHYRARTDGAGRYAVDGVVAGSYLATARVLGYAFLTRPVAIIADSAVQLNIALEAVPATLEQVVTTGAGPQRRVELGNAVASINADSVVRTAPVINLTDVISGRAPGVDVLQTNGMAGSGPAIRIRGRGSVSLSNDPIYIVDGVRIDGSPGGQIDPLSSQFQGSHNPSGSRLNDLDPDEIASIEILRGPSASTEYGTDAANGVVVITTKRGHSGAPRWSATAEEGLSTMPVHFPDNYYSWGHTTDGSNTATACPLIATPAFLGGGALGSVSGACVVDSVTRWQPLNHYETSLFGMGNRGHYQLQVSGGSTETQYSLSGGLTSEIGVLQMPATEVARLERERGQQVPRDQVRPNAVDSKVVRGRATTAGRLADLSVNAAYINNTMRSPDQAELLFSALAGAGIRDSLSGYGFSGSSFTTPAVVLSNTGTEEVARFTGGLSGALRPTTWLAARGTVGLDNANTRDQLLTLPGQGFGACANAGCTSFGNFGYRSVGLYQTSLYTVDLGATASVSITQSMISKTSVGMQYNDRHITGSAVAVGNLALGNPTLNGASVLQQLERGEEAATLGSYVDETIGFQDRLFLGGALRADAGSGFGTSYRQALYPKASASWVMRPEGGRVSLRLRAAYGQSGVQPPPGSALRLYVPTQTLVASGSVPSVVLSTIGTPGLQPERTAEEEGGIDIGFFHGRLAAEATGYAKLSHDALVSIPLGGSVGGGSQLINLGSVSNRGLEVSLTALVLDAQFAQWNVTVSGSDNENRLVTLGPGVSPIDQTSLFVAPYKQTPGLPLYGLWADRLHYSDLNHDGIIEANEVTQDATPSYIGPSLAPRELSINSAFTVFSGRVRVGAQVDHRGGQYLANTFMYFRDQTQHSQAANDRHAPLADQARAVAQLNDPLFRGNAGYIEPAAFTRFRELSLTYFASPGVAAALRARTVSLTVAGRNLALWTKYTGSDPEVSTAAGLNAITAPGGVPTTAVNPDIAGDYGSVPQVRYWTVKVNVGL